MATKRIYCVSGVCWNTQAEALADAEAMRNDGYVPEYSEYDVEGDEVVTAQGPAPAIVTGPVTVTYTSIDGCRTRRTFKTLTNARSFAHKRVGRQPEIGSTYAVSGDGIGKITVEGATLDQLFSY